jgi:hypothetical protein
LRETHVKPRLLALRTDRLDFKRIGHLYFFWLWFNKCLPVCSYTIH